MLPKNLKYGSKVESAPARSSRSNIQPQNGTGNYNLGDQITFNIPTRSNLVMVPTECYMKFNLVLKSGGDDNCFRWDSCGAHGLIQRIRVYHGSNLLEDIDNYGMLAKILFDLQVPTDATYGKLNVTTGTRNDLVVKKTYADAAALTTGVTNGTLSAYQVNSGDCLLRNDAGVATTGAIENNGTTFETTYCLNLISVIGSLCSQSYFPLFACTSSSLRVEIQLVDSIVKAMATEKGLAVGAIPSFTMSNVEYVGNFIELSDIAMSMISDNLQGQPLQFVIPQYKNFASSQWNLAVGSDTQISIPIPAKYSSLKLLLASCRDKGTGALKCMPFSSVSAKIQQYTFRIGPNVFPPKAPSTLSEMFSECLKAMGSISDLNYHPSIEKTSYFQDYSKVGATGDDPEYNAVPSGSFYIGLDLENYSSASKDSIFAGYNSNTDDIYLSINYKAQANAITPRFDIFACFDCVYVFENNTAYIRF